MEATGWQVLVEYEEEFSNSLSYPEMPQERKGF